MPYAYNGDVEIFYETFGDPLNPALLLINGLGSQCINFKVGWCEQFAAEGFLTIRFDNRDVGLSTKFDAVTPDVGAVAKALQAGEKPDVPYTLSDMAGDAVAVLDELAIERAHVLGLSMGGMIAQTIAIEHPERVVSLQSMMSSTGDADVGRSSPEVTALFFAPPPTDRESYIQRQLDGLKLWGAPSAYDEKRIAANAAEAFDRCFDPAGQARQLMAVMASGSRTKKLGSLSVPTQVLHGSADTLVPPEAGQRTADAIPDAKFVLIDGLGHDYPPQYWDEIVELVTTFARTAGTTP